MNLLPKDKKIEETLRWVNRFGMVATAAALVLFIGLSMLSDSLLRLEDRVEQAKRRLDEVNQ